MKSTPQEPKKKKSKLGLILVIIAVVGILIYMFSSNKKKTGEAGEDISNPDPNPMNCFTPDPNLEKWTDDVDWAGVEWIKINHNFEDDIQYVISWFKLVGLATKPSYADRYIDKIKAYVASDTRLPHWEVIAFAKACNKPITTNPF